MKNKSLLVAIATLSCWLTISCDHDGIPTNQPGCVTGVPNYKTERVTIGCGTQAQFNDFNIYRVDYKDLKWTPVSNCSECK
jgi:hypothetical protein